MTKFKVIFSTKSIFNLIFKKLRFTVPFTTKNLSIELVDFYSNLNPFAALPDTVVDSLNSSFTSNFSANTDDTVPYSQDRDSSPDRDIMSK